MTSCIVTIKTDHHYTCLKMLKRNKEQLQKTSGVDVLSSREKVR